MTAARTDSDCPRVRKCVRWLILGRVAPRVRMQRLHDGRTAVRSDKRKGETGSESSEKQGDEEKKE